jgi:hypothetical protein
MRAVPIIACALALAGCNFVYSEKPMFTAADSKGGAQLRPGVWMKPEPGCAFDKAGPVKTWPECAGGIILRPDRMVDPNKAGKVIQYVIAAGDPPVVQIPLVEEAKKPIFVYGGIRASKTDDRGRIVEFTSWIAQCGPPPPKPDPAAKKPTFVTEHPLPGLKVDKESGMCLATKPGPVRAAAKASEAWDNDKKAASWVRDGEE